MLFGKKFFYFFGFVQVVTLGLIVFSLLNISANYDLWFNIFLSILFPVITLIIECMIYCKK